MPLNNGGMTMKMKSKFFLKTFIVIGKFLIPFGPWCVGDEEVVVVVVVWYRFGKVGRVLPDNFSFSPGRPAGRDKFSHPD
jgi:hypothetical protein